MLLSEEQKYKELEKIVKDGTGRELTKEEERFLHWITGWEMETYTTLKGLFKSLSKIDDK